jgi:hypothetical protein
MLLKTNRHTSSFDSGVVRIVAVAFITDKGIVGDSPHDPISKIQLNLSIIKLACKSIYIGIF